MHKKTVTKTPKTVAKAVPKRPTPKAVAPSALTRDWVELEKEVMICSGNYSQSHKKFKAYNQQSSAVCVVACAFAAFRKLNTWSKQVLDEILEIGTNLYLKSRQISENRCLEHVQPPEVYKYFFVGNVKMSMRVSVDIVSALLPRDSKILTQTESLLNSFFQKHVSGVFSCQNTCFAIWKSGLFYVMFDPTEHNPQGGKWSGLPGFGFCCAIRFRSTKRLGDVLLKNSPLKQLNKFTIHPCRLEKQIVVNTKPPETLQTPEVVKPVKTRLVRPQLQKTVSKAVTKPPTEAVAQDDGKSVSKSMIPPEKPKLESVTNFVGLLTNRIGILRASTHNHDPKFTRYMGAQAMGDAVAALTMLRQHKSKHWIRNILDEVLKLGEVIHHDSKNLAPGQFVTKVTLNEKMYSPKIEKYGAIGRLESSDDKILSLEQALKDVLIDTDCCIVLGPQIVAVWKEDDKFYLFDPEERDTIGRCVQPDQPGVACVSWFAQIKDLVVLYMSNQPQSSHKDRFMVSKVTIEDYAPVAEDWHNFKALTYNTWILRANFSQQDRRFPPESRNAQCTANATMALAYKELKHEKDWDADTVDRMLINGDDFYRACVQCLQDAGKFKHKYLMVDELNRNFDVEDKRVNLEIDDCLVNGIVNAKSDTGIPNLRKGFEEFFTDSEAGIVTANYQSMAVWKRDEKYYYYDSHSRNEKGVVCGFGTACVLRLVTIDDLANALMTNLGPDRQNLYNISRVIVRLLDLNDEGVAKPPLNFYEALNELVAILRSNTSDKDGKFNINAGKQTVAMCLAALGFNTVSPAFEWCKEDVDQVMTFGDKLYVESMEANYREDLPEEEDVDDVTSANVAKQLKIGSNLIDFEFEEVSSGNYEDGLKEALQQLAERVEYEGNDAFQALLESQLLTVSMWKDDNLFYLFDPKPRDERGQVYGKDDWSVKIVDQEDIEDEGDEDMEEEDEDRDELAGGDNLGEYQSEQVFETTYEDNDDDLNDEEEEEEETKPLEKKGSLFWRMKEQEGKACVLRFSRVEDLIQHVLDNSPPNHRQEIDYVLKLVKTNNTPILHEVLDPEVEDPKDEFAGNWNEFKEVDYGKWILRSVHNLNDGLFPECNRGKQQIPMCMVALAFASLFALSKFSQAVVDGILAYGDRLYTLARKLRAKELKDNVDLGLSDEEIDAILSTAEFHIPDYPRNICMGENLTKWDAQMEVIAGDTTSKDPETVPNIPSGLMAFFQEHKLGVMECRNYPVAVWVLDDIFYMFDPNASGPSGMKSPAGVACITRFKDVEDLATIYLGNLPKLGNNFFEIHAFTFTKEKCVRERHPEEEAEAKPQKIGGFSAVTAGKHILRGDVKPDCTKYSRGVHIHSAAIAFVALALSLSKDPDTWTKIMINEILVVGEELYNDTLKKLGPKFNTWDDTLDVQRVNTDFQIGSLKVNTAIRFKEQRGVVDVKNSKTPNLRQGLERFFEENSHGILVTERLTLAVWELMKDKDVFIYMFDPNSRGVTGLPSQGGVACVMKFCNAKVASDHVMASLIGVDKTKTDFVIIPVQIAVGSVRSKRKLCKPVLPKPSMTTMKTKPVTTKPVTCPDKATIMEEKRKLRRIAEEERAKDEARRCALQGRNEMFQINTNEAIIRGLRSVAKDRELPVNLVAFVFMRIAADLDKWTYKQIELIIEAGYQLYVDSFNAYKPPTNKLTLQHVLRRVLLKDSAVKLEIKMPIVGGVLTKASALNGLNNFFTLSNFCMFSYDELLVSIYFKGGYYYLFDPYSRDLNGNKTEKGCAMLMKFSELEHLVEKIIKNFQAEQKRSRFALIVVAIQSVEHFNQ